jgi:hypothetical protein
MAGLSGRYETPPVRSDAEHTAGRDARARQLLHQTLRHNIVYHPPNDVAVLAHQQLRREVERLGDLAIEICPPTPELAEAIRKLTDEVLAGFNAAVARNHDRLTAPDGDDGTEWTYE